MQEKKNKKELNKAKLEEKKRIREETRINRLVILEQKSQKIYKEKKKRMN